MARLMTNYWISEVPSKIVWFKLSRFLEVRVVLRKPVTRADANRPVGSGRRIRVVLGGRCLSRV